MASVRRSRQEWEGIVREYLAAGVTAGRFASERGINQNTLLWWVYELRRNRTEIAPSFVHVELAAVPAEPFVVEVSGSGHRVIIPARFDDQELRRIVGALC